MEDPVLAEPPRSSEAPDPEPEPEPVSGTELALGVVGATEVTRVVLGVVSETTGLSCSSGEGCSTAG